VTSISNVGLNDAILKCYERIKGIKFDGMYFRRDIAKKALDFGEEISKKSLTYKDSGVDIDRGDSLVKMISPLTKKTARLGKLSFPIHSQ
jgi:hypothetical protein